MKAQRLRFRYRITPAALGLGQRDIVSAFEEALAAAGLPVARSQGKRANALISLAAPLPQGVTADGELADVFFAEYVAPEDALRRLAPAMPPGIEPVGVEEMGVGGPSLQSQLRLAVYEVRIPAAGLTEPDVRSRIAAILNARTHHAEREKDGKTRAFDLRPLILDITLNACGEDGYRLIMRLRAEPERTARADETVAALGLPEPLSIHRCSLHVEEIPPVIQAFRAAGSREK